MGSGHRSLSDKAACEVFKWHLQHPITSDLFQHGASYVAHCSDMGVELSLPDFHVSGSVEALLPDWLHRFIPPDIDVDDSNQAVPCAPLDVEDNIDGDFLEDDDVEPGGPAEAVAARAHQRAGPRAAESFLMPCAFTIGGLQHVVNNLCADVHQGMGNWAPFYSDLKAVEALLRVDERRQRFIWTCLQGTPLEGQSHRFQRFKGSLYESRWHEVLGFLKQLTGLLPKLARAWDSQKYIRGVNLDGQARPAQAQAENVQNQRQGLSVFDPAKVQEAVQSPLFHSYAAMALKLEEVPEALASAAEACPCHRSLFKHLSEHHRRKTLESHLGPGSAVCPMAGKLMPELVAGELEGVFEDICSLRETSLSLLPLPGLRSLTGQEWNTLISDFRQGLSSTQECVWCHFGRMFWLSST